MGVLIAGVAGGRMSIMTTRRRKSPEQIVRLLGQADQLLAGGEDLASVCRFHPQRCLDPPVSVDTTGLGVHRSDRITQQQPADRPVGGRPHPGAVGKGGAGNTCGPGCLANRVADRGEFYRDGLPSFGPTTTWAS